MKKFIFGTIVGSVIGALVQDKWDAKKAATENLAKGWAWTKKKIDSLKEDVKENIDSLKEDVND